MIGDYHITLEEVVRKHGQVDVITFMFYGQPGIRDMEILRLGIEGYFALERMPPEILDNIDNMTSAEKVTVLKEMKELNDTLYYYISAEEIDEETGRAFDVNRGWMIRFMFVENEGGEIFRDAMADYLDKGLNELRIEHSLLDVKEVKFNV